MNLPIQEKRKGDAALDDERSSHGGAEVADEASAGVLVSQLVSQLGPHPATILGLRIGFAVLLHEGSTLVVVINALRLLVYKK